MKLSSRPRVVWPEGFDERAIFEMPLKGWLQAYVESEDGCRYPVYFSDPVRLQQDLDQNVKLGEPCFTEPGLIILPEVTVEAIENAVQFLWMQGFFVHLKAEHGDANIKVNGVTPDQILSSPVHQQFYGDRQSDGNS